ncbi:hypothetical protein ACFFX1_20285 [Dactylosporangium sucinum]|uniref:Uncharacterized protein n=1 Tax=Dactylosporangium sucinum TaxID=1424081 RepID=A0A917X0W4_9ACTN|nr:hypothetical protein [Dactylosporangium sucinum]GGM49864.1 hypothetical protein GCM10007977_059430 [Dactylosporangium sucinum]
MTEPLRHAVAAVEVSLAEVRAEWDRLLGRVEAGIRLVERRLATDGWFGGIVERVTADAADGLALIRHRLAMLRLRVGRVLDRAELAAARAVPVLALLDASLAWLPAVFTPVTGVAAALDPPGRNLVYWAGPAKDAYLEVAREQLDALGQAAAQARATSDWLAEVATANLAYLTGLADRVAAVAAALTTACLEGAATMAGVLTQFPSSLQDLADLVGTVVGELVSGAAHLAERLAADVASVRRLSGELADHTALPGGRWPRSIRMDR